MNTPWKKILASLVGPLALTAVALTTAPGAQAAPQAGAAAQGTVWEIWNNYNGRFLTEAGDSRLHALPGNNRREQLWHERAGDRRSNAGTGRCLDQTLEHRIAGTMPCRDGAWTQQWIHESRPGGVVIKTSQFNYCLTSGDDWNVWVEPCRADKRQLWSVRPVF